MYLDNPITVCNHIIVQDLDQRDEFSKRFREADINGLHLLELTSAEMTGEENCSIASGVLSTAHWTIMLM